MIRVIFFDFLFFADIFRWMALVRLWTSRLPVSSSWYGVIPCGWRRRVDSRKPPEKAASRKNHQPQLGNAAVAVSGFWDEIKMLIFSAEFRIFRKSRQQKGGKYSY